MTCWLLEPKNEHEMWNRFDGAYGFIVIADCSSSARKLAAQQAGDEGSATWLSEIETSCVELPINEPEQRVFRVRI